MGFAAVLNSERTRIFVCVVFTTSVVSMLHSVTCIPEMEDLNWKTTATTGTTGTVQVTTSLPFSTGHRPVIKDYKAAQELPGFTVVEEQKDENKITTLPNFYPNAQRICACAPWPICPGKEHGEVQPGPNTTFFLAKLNEGFMAKSVCHPVVPGKYFTRTHVFNFVQWTYNPCHDQAPRLSQGSPVQSFEALASSMGPSYPGAAGHYIVHQLPRVAFLLRVLPDHIPILAVTTGMAGRVLEALGLNSSRLVNYDSNTVYHAKELYFTSFSPYGTVSALPSSFKEASDLFESHLPLQPAGLPVASQILVLQRQPGPRQIENLDEVVAAVQARWPSEKVQVFTPGGGTTFLEDACMARTAKLLIAPHGAGLFHALFTAPGTPIMEIAYCSKVGMEMPMMYWDMCRYTNRPYYGVASPGGYGTALPVPLDELNSVLKMITLPANTSTRRWLR